MCLPAVLNDPRNPIRNSEPLPNPPPTPLPKVSRKNFDLYLAKLHKRVTPEELSAESPTEHQSLFLNSVANRIPPRFNQKDFDMKNEISLSLGGTTDLINNLSNHDLQLKQWLDMTEVELGRRLSSRATSFLAAVSAQDQLKNILRDARETSARLRVRVNQVGISGTKSNFSGLL